MKGNPSWIWMLYLQPKTCPSGLSDVHTWTTSCWPGQQRVDVLPKSTNSWNMQENVSSEFALKNSCIDAWFVSLLTSKETNSCEFHFNEETEYSPRIHRHYTRVMNWFACVNYISLQKQEVSETTGVSLLFSLYQSSCFHSSYIPRPPCLCLIFLFGLCVSLSLWILCHSTQSVKSTNRTET